MGITEQLVNAVQSGLPQAPAPAQPQAPQYGYNQPGGFPPQYQQPQQPAPDDYVTGAQMQTFAQQQAAVWQQQQEANARASAEQQANLALNFVRQQHGQMFDKYGPEIYGHLAQIPDRRQWTVDNLNTVIKMVRGNHVEEIGREIANRLVAEMAPTLRSGGGGSNALIQSQPATEFSLESDKLPAEWAAKARAVGLTERQVDEFCAANSMSREAFFGQFVKNGSVIAETSSTDPTGPLAGARTL